MPWTYSGDPSAADKDAVRFEIQDTTESSPLLQDAEVEWAILSETTVAAGVPTTMTIGNVYRAAARCLEVLSRLFAAQADTQIGSLKATYSKQSQVYSQRATDLRLKAQGMNAPYVGGLSETEKRGFQQDTDLVQPSFTRREFDNPWASRQAGLDPQAEDFGPPAG